MQIHDKAPLVELLHTEQAREFFNKYLCASCTN